MDTILQTTEKPPGSAGGCRSCCETHKEHGQRLQQAQNWKLQSSAWGGLELATERPQPPPPTLHAKVFSRVQLCNCMDYSPPGSSVHGILQARILEWVAMPSSRGSSQSRNLTHTSSVSCIGRWVPYH